MSTLLKAHLLKTDNPFIMLKCYLEDILKEQGLTWDDLVDALHREAGDEKLYELKISPELIEALGELKSEAEPWGELGFWSGPVDYGKYGLKIALPRSDKENKRIYGRKKGASKRTTELGGDTMHPNVRAHNIRNFISALKETKEYQNYPSLTKVVKGLEGVLRDIIAAEDEKPSKDLVAVREKGKKTVRGKRRVETLKNAIKDLDKIKKLVSSITDDDIMDFEGKMIYSPSLMKEIYNLLPKPENVVRLKTHANGEVIEDLKKLYGLDNKELESVKNKRDKDYLKIMERLNLSKDEEKDFSERIKKLEEIRDTLSKPVKYVTLKGEEERPLYEAIIDVRQSKTNVQLIDDIAEHKNANEIMSNLWKDLKKFGGKGLMAKLLKEPRVRERMGLPPTDEEISEKETQRIMDELAEGKEVTWGN